MHLLGLSRCRSRIIADITAPYLVRSLPPGTAACSRSGSPRCIARCPPPGARAARPAVSIVRTQERVHALASSYGRSSQQPQQPSTPTPTLRCCAGQVLLKHRCCSLLCL